tara:strand:+ start:2339 stop:2884 length:546 start_codon:yes stop_codon:yes gene_type:complete
MKIEYVQASTHIELEQILKLQKDNLPVNLSEKIQKKEGFLTVEHNLEILVKLNADFPHTIAKSNNSVVGYALSMDPKFKNEIPILEPLFEKAKAMSYDEKRYIVMGQICIAKPFRNQGIFRGLYKKMKEFTSDRYDHIITEVNARNERSLNAHLAVGFEIIKVYNHYEQTWNVIALKTDNL